VEYRRRFTWIQAVAKLTTALGLALGANGDLDNAGNEYSKALTLQTDLDEVRSSFETFFESIPIRREPLPSMARLRLLPHSLQLHTTTWELHSPRKAK